MFRLFDLKQLSAAYIANKTPLGTELEAFAAARNSKATPERLAEEYSGLNPQLPMVILALIFRETLERRRRRRDFDNQIAPCINDPIPENDFKYEANYRINVNASIHYHLRQRLKVNITTQRTKLANALLLAAEMGWLGLCRHLFEEYGRNTFLLDQNYESSLLSAFSYAVGGMQIATVSYLWEQLEEYNKEYYFSDNIAFVTQSIIQSFEQGNTGIFKFLINKPSVPLKQIIERNGFYLILVAARNGNVENLRLLWETTVNLINPLPDTLLPDALETAAESGQLQAFQYLYHRMDVPRRAAYLMQEGEGIFQLAIRQANFPMADFLLPQFDADMRNRALDRVNVAPENRTNTLAVLKYLASHLSPQQMSTRLHRGYFWYVCTEGMLDAVKYYWDLIDTDEKFKVLAEYGENALLNALIRGFHDCVEFIWDNASLKLREKILFADEAQLFRKMAQAQDCGAIKFLWRLCDKAEQQYLLECCVKNGLDLSAFKEKLGLKEAPQMFESPARKPRIS